MILRFCTFKSLIGTDMTFIILASMCRYELNLYSVSCVHDVTVLNAAICMTCSLFMPADDVRGDHMEEAYSKAGVMTAL